MPSSNGTSKSSNRGASAGPPRRTRKMVLLIEPSTIFRSPRNTPDRIDPGGLQRAPLESQELILEIQRVELGIVFPLMRAAALGSRQGRCYHRLGGRQHGTELEP